MNPIFKPQPKLIGAILLAAILLQACVVTKKYERPKDVLADSAYRTDLLQADTTNIADLSWRNLFTDPLLAGYIQQALDSNLDVRVALEQINAAEAYRKQARAAFFPTFSVGPRVSYGTSSLNSQLGRIIGERQHLMQYEITGNLAWEADIWGRLRSNERALVANLLRTEAAHQTVKSQLVANIADAYYRLLSLDEQRIITDSTIAYRERNLETTKALKEAGTLTEVAVKQSEAQLWNARGILIDIDNDIKLQENFLSVLLGMPPQKINRSTIDAQRIETQLTVGVPAQLLRNRPDIKAAEYALVNAFELVNVARASFYPSLSISGNTGLQSIDVDKIFSPNSLLASVGTSLLQPVLARRQLRTQKEVSEANRQMAYYDYRNTILDASRDVSDALYTYDAQTKLIKIKQQEFAAYDSATAFSRELVNYGMANYLEVLRATENALQAQLSFVNAKYGRLSAVVQLYRALGGGWR